MPWNVRYHIRKTQYGYDREFVVFDDWCQREDHIDSSMVVGSNEEVSQAILKGDMLVNEAHLRRIDECVATNYIEAFFKPDFVLEYDEFADAEIWRGRMKGGPPTMANAGLETCVGAGNKTSHDVWKEHEFGFGPFADKPFTFRSIKTAVARLRGNFEDYKARGLVSENPFHSEAVTRLMRIMERFMDTVPLYRSRIFENEECMRLIRFLDLRRARDSIFAYHFVAQLQRGVRGATSTIQIWADFEFTCEGCVVTMPPSKTSQVARALKQTLEHPTGCSCGARGGEAEPLEFNEDGTLPGVELDEEGCLKSLASVCPIALLMHVKVMLAKYVGVDGHDEIPGNWPVECDVFRREDLPAGMTVVVLEHDSGVDADDEFWSQRPVKLITHVSAARRSCLLLWGGGTWYLE